MPQWVVGCYRDHVMDILALLPFPFHSIMVSHLSDQSIHTHTMILSYYDAYTIVELCRWDDRSSVVTPHEDTFYLVAFLRSALPDSGDPTQSLEYLSRQNKKILEFCDDAGIEIKQYLPDHRSRAEWARHFGPKWGRFLRQKGQFDPKCMLATGQGIPFPLVRNSWLTTGHQQDKDTNS